MFCIKVVAIGNSIKGFNYKLFQLIAERGTMDWDWIEKFTAHETKLIYKFEIIIQYQLGLILEHLILHNFCGNTIAGNASNPGQLSV